MTNMSIQPLWLTHFIEILLVPEFQLTKFIIGVFSYKAHFRPQISFNAWFDIPKEPIPSHGKHFQNNMMVKLDSKLGYKKEQSSSYYPQANGQVGAVREVVVWNIEAEEELIRGNLGSKMGLIRKRAKISFCELEFKNQ